MGHLLSEGEVLDPIVDGGGRGACGTLAGSNGGRPVACSRRHWTCLDGGRGGEEGGEGAEGGGEDVGRHDELV